MNRWCPSQQKEKKGNCWSCYIKPLACKHTFEIHKYYSKLYTGEANYIYIVYKSSVNKTAGAICGHSLKYKNVFKTVLKNIKRHSKFSIAVVKTLMDRAKCIPSTTAQRQNEKQCVINESVIIKS